MSFRADFGFQPFNGGAYILACNFSYYCISNGRTLAKVGTGPLLRYSVTNEFTFLSNGPSNGSHFMLRCSVAPLLRYSISPLLR